MQSDPPMPTDETTDHDPLQDWTNTLAKECAVLAQHVREQIAADLNLTYAARTALQETAAKLSKLATLYEKATLSEAEQAERKALRAWYYDVFLEQAVLDFPGTQS